MNDLIIALRKKRMEGTDNPSKDGMSKQANMDPKPMGLEAKIDMLDQKMDRILACVEPGDKSGGYVDNSKGGSNAY